MGRQDLLLSALVVPLLPNSQLAQTPEKVWWVGLLTPNQFGAHIFRQLNLPELARLGFHVPVQGALGICLALQLGHQTWP